MEMNSYYAHESSVGPVFDVARYSWRKAIFTSMVAMGFALLTGLGAIYLWNPDWIVSDPPEWFADAHEDAKQAWVSHPTASKIGFGTLAALSGLFDIAGVICLINAMSRNYYIRSGAGGVSIRVPDGLKVLQVDLPWDQIERLTVLQEKYVGSMSRNSGNVSASIRIETRSGTVHDFSVDHFSEPAYLIHERINEATQTGVAELSA